MMQRICTFDLSLYEGGRRSKRYRVVAQQEGVDRHRLLRFLFHDLKTNTQKTTSLRVNYFGAGDYNDNGTEDLFDFSTDPGLPKSQNQNSDTTISYLDNLDRPVTYLLL